MVFEVRTGVAENAENPLRGSISVVPGAVYLSDFNEPSQYEYSAIAAIRDMDSLPPRTSCPNPSGSVTVSMILGSFTRGGRTAAYSRLSSASSAVARSSLMIPSTKYTASSLPVLERWFPMTSRKHTGTMIRCFAVRAMRS